MERPKDDAPNILVNERLMKITGLYQLLSRGGRGWRDMNAYGWAAVASIACLVAAMHTQFASIFYHLDDVNDCVQYVLMMAACASTVFKLYRMLRYRDSLWACVQMTQMDRLSCGWHRTRTQEAGRFRLKVLSTVVFVIWSTSVVFWVGTPFMLWGRFKDVTFADGRTRRYRVNVFNYNFQIAGESYDKYFAVAYPLEAFTMFTWVYGELMFDVLLVSLYSAVSYQLTSVADSFTELGAGHENDQEVRSTNDGEPILNSDFKTLVQDQQFIFNNIRKIYQICRPMILYQIATDSTILILISTVILMNLYNGISLVSPIYFKFMCPVPFYTLHLFLICYLFSDVDEKKSSMNFAMYCSDWTKQSLQYKKLLLYAMRMNCADNLKLKVTSEKIVDFKLYGGIIRSTYSILSVLAKSISRKM